MIADFKDILGQIVEVGDRIAYARQGSGSDHGTLAIGKVIELGEKLQGYYSDKMVATAKIDWEIASGYGRQPKRSTITKFENLVKLA